MERHNERGAPDSIHSRGCRGPVVRLTHPVLVFFALTFSISGALAGPLIASLHGLEITMETTAKSPAEGKALLLALGFPFKKEES